MKEVPYKPNPMKYAYLLQNEYPTISNLHKKTQQPNSGASATAARSLTPTQPDKDSVPPTFGADSSKQTEVATESVATEQQKPPREVSPSPEFGGTGGRTTNNNSSLAGGGFKLGDAIGVKEKRPTNIERERNVGLFGRGGGDFDARGNMKASPLMFDQSASPSVPGKKNKSLLGDYTLYRVNKEFENF